MRETRYKILPYDTGHFQWDGRGDYLQWWYFDAEFPSGHRMMTIMIPVEPGAVEDHGNGAWPGILTVIMDPDHNNHTSYEYYPGRFEADTERMRATFGDNLVEWVDGRYRLHIRQGGIGYDLEYFPTLPPWPPMPGRGGYLFKPLTWSLVPGKYLHYVSYVPRGRVKGRLVLPGEEIEVEGEGYHEQGRTNGHISNIFSYWFWIRLFLGDWTIIFPSCEPPIPTLREGILHALLVYHKDRCVADLFDMTGLLLRDKVLERQTYEPAGRHDIPRRYCFSAHLRDLRLHVEMDLYHQLAAFCWKPFAGKAKSTPAWFQHLADVEVDMRLKGQPIHLEGKGVFEAMFTGGK